MQTPVGWFVRGKTGVEPLLWGHVQWRHDVSNVKAKFAKIILIAKVSNAHGCPNVETSMA